MGAPDLLGILQAEGYVVALQGEGLRVRGPRPLSAPLEAELRATKGQVVALLMKRDPQSYRWRIEWRDGTECEITIVPLTRRSEVLQSYRDATSAVPIGGCRSCMHRSALNRCGSLDRADLQPCYGDGHPLKWLPPDEGLSCIWQSDGSG